MFVDFLSKGLCVIPLRAGVPQVEWSQYFYEKPSKDIVKLWRGDEYALVCGGVSGVIAVDIDTDDLAQDIELLAGVSPVKKLGSKGFTAFYRHNGEQSHIWKDPSTGEVICELLSDKRLTTIPPSPHRKTKTPYKWIGSAALGDTELPALKSDFILFMDTKYPKPKRLEKPSFAYSSYDNKSSTLSDVADMLEYISSDCPRDEWIAIGMALRDEFGDAACDLWHRWSARAGKRYDHNAAQSSWRSFHGSGVTIGTIVYRAKQGGWIPPITATSPAFEVDLSYLYNKKLEPTLSSPVTRAVIKIPGLVGEIADWITATAISPQPVLSLAAALTFMGLVKGQRIKHKIQGARTNILTLSLAPTGGGKDYPQKAIDTLGIAVGLEKNLMGRPTSGTALLTGLAKGSGLSLLSVDEMGRYIGNITTKNSQSYQREIADYMIELFSSANKIFRGRQYADEKKNPQIILKHPHFCCLGSTVPEKLRAACSSSEVIDGFLNRWLVFSAEGRPEKRFDNKSLYPPKELIDRIIYWMAENPLPVKDVYGNEAPDSHGPREVSFTPEAWDMFLAFEREMTVLMDNQPYPINELYVRSAEHVVKLSMIISDDTTGGIGTNDITAAITIVRQSNEQIATFASSITDNQHEADVVFILDIIKKWPGISRNQLTQRTRRINHKLRSDILAQLIEAGDIAVTEGANKRLTFTAN